MMNDLRTSEDVPNWLSPQMIALWSALSLEQRATKLGELFQAGRELMTEGIRLREPSLSISELRQTLKQLLHTHYKSTHA